MKYELMLKILYLLLSKKKVSAAYIARRFEISTRTAFRYLTAISLANIPLIAEPGRNGGYYIAESFKLPAIVCTEKEFNAIVSTLEAYNEQLMSSDIDSALEKLRALKRSDFSDNKMTAGHFIIDGSDWNGSETTKNVVGTIEKAIENSLVVEIKYRDKSGEETTRQIEPQIIILKQGLWYIYAFCRLRNDFRVFKASRIIYAHVTEITYAARENAKENLKLDKWFESLPCEPVELELTEAARTDVEEWLGVESVYTGADGKLRASAILPCDDWLISKLLGYGNKVKIIHPKYLIHEVSAAAESVLELYKND